MKWTNQHTMKKTNIGKSKSDYIMVAERISWLNSEHFPYDYSLTSSYTYLADEKTYVVEATFIIHTKEKDLVFTGLADERVGSNYINKDNALENCQTSAWGRAIAGAGIGYVGDAIASVEEMDKGKRYGATNAGKAKANGTADAKQQKMSKAVYENVIGYLGSEDCLVAGDIVKAIKRIGKYQCSETQQNGINSAYKQAKARINKSQK